MVDNHLAQAWLQATFALKITETAQTARTLLERTRENSRLLEICSREPDKTLGCSNSEKTRVCSNTGREHLRKLEKARARSGSNRASTAREHQRKLKRVRTLLEKTRENSCLLGYRSRNLEKTNVQSYCSRKLSRRHRSLLHFTLFPFTLWMYIHRSTLVYIYIYI